VACLCAPATHEAQVYASWGAALWRKANRGPLTVLSTNRANQLLAVRNPPFEGAHVVFVNVCEVGEVLCSGSSICEITFISVSQIRSPYYYTLSLKKEGAFVV
jgi:hypothetical protein